MRNALIPRPAPSVAFLLAMLVLVVAATQPSHARAQDACTPGDAGACLPLPPCRMLPQPARPPDLDAPVMPAPAARLCAAREAVAAVNRANDLYVRAVSTLNTAVLGEAWADEALAEIGAQVATLRAFGRIATPRLLETSLLGFDARGASADADAGALALTERDRDSSPPGRARSLVGQRLHSRPSRRPLGRDRQCGERTMSDERCDELVGFRRCLVRVLISNHSSFIAHPSF
jgi:hypothetical protein